MTFDAVIFDCDGVLVDSEAPGLEASASYLQSRGLSYTAGDLVRLFTGLRDDVFAERLIEAYREANGTTPPDDFFAGLVGARRSHAAELRAVPGAAGAVAAVRGPKAVASSSRADYLASKLRRTGLFDAFAPHIYSAELVARGKPAPDVFLLAAERLGASPSRALVVEDSPNGVLAGRAAGMTVWGFSGGAHCFEGHEALLRDAGADRVLADFEDFSAALAGSA